MDRDPPGYEIDVVRAYEIGELARIEKAATAIFPREDLQTAPDPFVPASFHEAAVLPEHGRRGLGRALLERAIEWARERGHPRMTLTTFHHLPWNGPFYRSAGFEETTELGPELRAILGSEARKGLRNRIAMALDLSRSRSAR